MPLKIGTCCFVSVQHATDYYYATTNTYADAQRLVQQKIADGGIYIGKPTLEDGERLGLIDKGTRYCLIIQ